MIQLSGAAATLLAALIITMPTVAAEYRSGERGYVVADGDRHVRGAERRLPYAPSIHRGSSSGDDRGWEPHRGGRQDDYPRFYGDLRRSDRHDGRHADDRGRWHDDHDWRHGHRDRDSHEWDHRGHVPRQGMGPRSDFARREGIPSHHFHGYREHAHPDGFDGRGLQHQPFARDGRSSRSRGGMGGR